MKKFIIAAFTIFTAMSASAFAPKKTKFIKPEVEQAFFQEFGNMPNVEWSRDKNDITHASFTVNNEKMEACFDKEGTYIGTLSKMELNELPVKLQLKLERDYSKVSVSAIMELANNDETAYYIQVTDAKGTRVLKAYGDGSISVWKKL